MLEDECQACNTGMRRPRRMLPPLAAIVALNLLLLVFVTLPRRPTPLAEPKLDSKRNSEVRLQAPPKALNFAAGRIAVQEAQASSLFSIHRQSLLPLLRLSAAEADRDFRIREGRRWMRNKTVVFVGTARNAKKHMPANVRDIERLGRLFKNYWMVFVENDSYDGTRRYLLDLRRRFNQTVVLGCGLVNSEAECRLNITYRSGARHRPGWAQKRTRLEREDRAVTMSVLRNMYLDYVYDNLADVADLMIAIEPDISWRPWDLDGIAQGLYYFGSRPRLDSLCANGRLWGKLYDPCSIAYFSKRHFDAPDDPQQAPDASDRIALEMNSLPVKVDSCFQAFAAYRVSSLAARRLHFAPAPGEVNCEHNTLSRQLSENYIDPAMRLDIYSLVVHSLDPVM